MKKPLLSRLLTLGLPGLISCFTVVWWASQTSTTHAASNDYYVWPIQGTVTLGFGGIHEGIDIDAPQGTPVVAAASGKVTEAGEDTWGLGNKIAIKHPHGTITVYGHNKQLLVRQGQQVKQGQLIAYSGTTGNSNRPHLHFEIRLDAYHPVDPLKFLPPLLPGKRTPVRQIRAGRL